MLQLLLCFTDRLGSTDAAVYPRTPTRTCCNSHATHAKLASDHRKLSAACMPPLIPLADTLQAA